MFYGKCLRNSFDRKNKTRNQLRETCEMMNGIKLEIEQNSKLGELHGKNKNNMKKTQNEFNSNEKLQNVWK